MNKNHREDGSQPSAGAAALVLATGCGTSSGGDDERGPAPRARRASPRPTCR